MMPDPAETALLAQIHGDMADGKLDSLVAFFRRGKPISGAAASQLGFILAAFAGDPFACPDLLDFQLGMTLKKGRKKRTDSYHRIEAAAHHAIELAHMSEGPKIDAAITESAVKFGVSASKVRARFHEIEASPFSRSDRVDSRRRR